MSKCLTLIFIIFLFFACEASSVPTKSVDYKNKTMEPVATTPEGIKIYYFIHRDSGVYVAVSENGLRNGYRVAICN